MKFKNFSIFFIVIYLLLIILKISLFKYTFSEFRGRTEDAFLWSYCALELSKGRLPSLIPNFHFQVGYMNNTEVPAYLVGYLSPGFTFLLFVFLKIFQDIYMFYIFLFFVSLINLFLIYKILKLFNVSDEAKILTFATILFSPMFLIFSFKLRPDQLSLLFALLSIFFILRKKIFISSILFSISVFGFKIQTIVWIFFLLYLIRNLKNSLIFLLIFFLSFATWFFSLYIPINSKYPMLISYLLYSNTIHIFDLKRIFLNYNYILNMVQLVGIFSIYGIFYLIGCLQYIIYLRMTEIIPIRSFNSIILNFSFAYIYDNFKKFRNLLRIILSLQITLNLLFFIFDLRVNSDTDKFYRKLEELTRNRNVKVCSYFRESNFYLHLFFPNRENLTYFFSRRLYDYKNCDVITYQEPFRKTIIYNNSVFDFKIDLGIR